MQASLFKLVPIVNLILNMYFTVDSLNVSSFGLSLNDYQPCGIKMHPGKQMCRLSETGAVKEMVK